MREMNRAIALVVALANERRALQSCLAGTRTDRMDGLPAVHGEVAGHPVLLVQAGVGFSRARAAVEAVARRHRLAAAWSLGLAGGLIDSLKAGDLLCPLAILPDAADAKPLVAGPAAPKILEALAAAGLPAHSGLLFTSRVALRTPEEKRAAHQRTTASAVDMEAAGVAAATRELRIPTFALKAVSDPVGEPLPQIVTGCTTITGDLNWRGILCALASSDGRRTLPRLARATRQAEAALCQALPVALGASALVQSALAQRR